MSNLPKLSHLLAEQTNCSIQLQNGDALRCKSAIALLRKMKAKFPTDDWSDFDTVLAAEDEADVKRDRVTEINAIIDKGDYEDDINPRTPNEE